MRRRHITAAERRGHGAYEDVRALPSVKEEIASMGMCDARALRRAEAVEDDDEVFARRWNA